jgi:hypothetical protein
LAHSSATSRQVLDDQRPATLQRLSIANAARGFRASARVSRRDDATIECREALALPSDPERAVILRRIQARRGTARVKVVLNPRGDFWAQVDRQAQKTRRRRMDGRIERHGRLLDGRAARQPSS